MIRNIEIPYHLRQGTKRMNTGFPKKVNIIAIDTETVKGEPYTIQFATLEGEELFFVNKENVTGVFLRELERRVKKNEFNILYGHNLQFDLSVLFHPFHNLFIKDKFEVKINNVYCIVYTGKLFFAEILFKDIKVVVYDTFRFVMTSLDKACTDLQLPIRKLPTPEGLGEKRLKNKEFKEYALNDARIQYILSSWIVDRCRDYDIPIPISIAQFAQYIFKKNFLPKGTTLTFPPMDAVNMALLSYHGGKNGCYVNTPSMLKDIYAYDINSAYPYAMAELPSFLGGEYKRVKSFNDKYIGVYQISGKYKKCKYPNLYDHTFKVINDEKISDICFTSYEIMDALEHNELEIDKIDGYIFIPSNNDSPLKAYVNHFFDIKSTSKDLTQYWIAKICLNSLYGKFIQTNESITNERLIISQKQNLVKVEDVIYKAGGMFNPFIGTLITAHTRVYCHNLQHKTDAIHTATDSIFTKQDILSDPNKYNIKIGSGLGELKFEGKGDLLLLRNKLYIHFSGKYQDYKISDINGKKTVSGIRKYALHGFHAKLYDLLDLWKSKRNGYNYKKMTLIKESIIQKNMNRKPNMINDYESILDIDWERYYEE